MQVNNNATIFSGDSILGNRIKRANLEKEIDNLKQMKDRVDSVDQQDLIDRKNMEELKVHISDARQIREKADKSWKSFGTLAVLSAIGVTAAGGGIPSIILAGAALGFAVKGGVDFMKTQNVDSNLQTYSDAYSSLKAKIDIDNPIDKDQQLTTQERIKKAEQEKLRLEQEEEKLIEDAKVQKDANSIKDSEKDVSIGGVVLKKRIK